MTLDKLKPGMIVYDVTRYRMGNTTLRSVSVVLVRIISVDAETGRVTAIWNGNRERAYPMRIWSKWRMTKPELVTTGVLGQKRLAKRGEVTEGTSTTGGLK